MFAVPLRIALISRELAPFYGAGIGVYAANMARAWADAGHEVHVLTGRWKDLGARAVHELPGVRVHSVRPRSPSILTRRRPHDFQRYALGVRSLVRSLHRRAPFDYIEAPDYWGEARALLASRPRNALIALRLHTPTHECALLNDADPSEPSLRALAAAEDAALVRADVLVSPTHALLEIVRARLRIDASRGEVIPYPFSWAPAVPGARPRPDLPPLILYFGRLERRKGVETLLDAAQGLLDSGHALRVRLIGADTRTAPNAEHGAPDRRGSMLEHLRARVLPRHAHAFEFLPAVPRDKLPAHIDEARACCFPSLWENFPNACLEAMSRGALVVASDAGGMAEIVRDGASGILYRAGTGLPRRGDPVALAQSLTRALSDDALRARVIAEAPARVRELCDPAIIVKRTAAMIERRRAALTARTDAKRTAGT